MLSEISHLLRCDMLGKRLRSIGQSPIEEERDMRSREGDEILYSRFEGRKVVGFWERRGGYEVL